MQVGSVGVCKIRYVGLQENPEYRAGIAQGKVWSPSVCHVGRQTGEMGAGWGILAWAGPVCHGMGQGCNAWVG